MRIGYKITEHFLKIYLPRDDQEKRAAIIESLKSPDTYQQLFKDYEYHVVPVEGVKNHFIRGFSMAPNVAERAAEVFYKNLKDFDLLDNRGVLMPILSPKPQHSEAKIDEDGGALPDNTHPIPSEIVKYHAPVAPSSKAIILECETDASKMKTIPIHLLGSKQAWLVYPSDMNEDDIEIVTHQVQGVLMRIKLEQKRKESQ